MQQFKSDFDIRFCMMKFETLRCEIDGCVRKADVNILIYFRDRRRKAIVRDLCKRHGCDKEIHRIKG
jgi:predicted AAA+ superfamily ATPase